MPENYLPPEYLARMKSLLGDDSPAFLAHYNRRSLSGLRVNTLKLSPEAFGQIAPFELEPLPWAPAGFILPGEDQQHGKHLYHAAGLYYLQEPAAQAVAAVLDPQPGERVLDIAAAPGGKATHIAARMQNQGVLVANEIHQKRAWDLTRNLEKWGARNVVVMNETPERLLGQFPAYFDRVLVDAPCSGEGMFRRSPALVKDWSPAFIESCAVRQAEIMYHAAGLVRPGGWLCYATCTFNLKEDEEVIAQFLQANPDFDLVTPAWAEGFSGMLPSSLSSQPGEATPVRLWPHRAPGEGHFIALLHKKGDGHSPGLPAWPASRGLDRLAGYWKDFSRDVLRIQIKPARLRLVKSYLYAVPADMPDPGGLNMTRAGWWLGSFKKDRFEPGHALAMSLGPGDVNRRISLNEEQAGAYLRREALRLPGENGWTLVLLNGRFPLGWGKMVRGVLKNHLPAGLRLQP